MLSPDELARYQRQILLQGFGEAGQEKLKKARVGVAGAGGLGSPAVLYLTAAGVGQIRVVDADSVELSNLNRQVLHWTPDIGRNKVDSAGYKLNQLNPEIKIEAVKERIEDDNVADLFQGQDIIIDAVDNLEARYLLNRMALQTGIPLVHGAVHGFEGRALTILPGQSACLMCIYHGVTIHQKIPVLGVTAGIIACIQAMEAIKYLTGIGQLLAGRLLIFDGLNLRFSEIKISRNPDCPHCGQ